MAKFDKLKSLFSKKGVRKMQKKDEPYERRSATAEEERIQKRLDEANKKKKKNWNHSYNGK